MTAEQKLEKCKELVERTRNYAREQDWSSVGSAKRTVLNQAANELQAILEEDDERED